uniref:Carrier domain-containing protein n=1 Tax=Pseudoalteromonas rubra TaxID=43658 RepID=A0A0F4QX57_9GAMM|nr:hypothetical protein TW77_06320 [Pseudoalteromonas rubra]
MSRSILLKNKNGELKVSAPTGVITEQDKQAIMRNKAAILEYLSLNLNETSLASHGSETIPRNMQSGPIPLSFSQQRLWFIDRLQGGSAQYNMPMVLRVTGQFDIDVAEQAVNRIIQRHESLRTLFNEGTSGAYQYVRESFDFRIKQLDLSHFQHEEQQQQLSDLLRQDSEAIFDLRADLMLRASCLKLNGNESILLFNMHHIVSDGWSMAVLGEEFFSQYRAVLAGQPDPLAPLPIQYSDYAHWQHRHMSAEKLKQQEAYWRQQLAGVPSVHGLPLEQSRSQDHDNKLAVVTGHLDQALSAALEHLAVERNMTPFMLVHSALALVLSRHSNSTDIVIGTPVANRAQAELAPLIGLFVNTTVLRANTAHTELDAYLAHIREIHIDAQANQDLPFEQLLEVANVPRNASHTPLFQIMLSMDVESGRDTCQQLNSDVCFELIDSQGGLAKFDLDISLERSKGGFEVSWGYNASLFARDDIARLNTHFQRLLTVLVSDQDLRRAHEAMLPSQEVPCLLPDPDGASVVAEHLCFHTLFEHQAEQTPQKAALVCNGNSLSYRELNEKADQLAAYLTQNYDIQADTLIGLCAVKSSDLVIAILGILKAGAAYVPLDPDYPEQRLAYIIEDGGLNIVLTQQALAENLAFSPANVIAFDKLDLTGYTACATPVAADPAQLMYVIYTSGSSGAPKGVLIEHKAVCNLALYMHQLELGQSGSWGWCAPCVFDASVQGLTQLAMGQTLVIVSDEDKKDLNSLRNLIETCDIGVLDCTPSLLALWQAQGTVDQLPELVIGGEAIKPEVWRELAMRQARAFNMYGPTECTVNSTVARIVGEQSQLGHMVANARGVILDAMGRPVPTGCPGELYIGGAGLARGYLNREALNKSSFIQNKAFPQAGLRLYKTGDLVRLNKTGALEYLGRNDGQVKFYGYRIELGEIESQICVLDQVDSAQVLIHKENENAAYLHAFIKLALAHSEDSTPVLTQIKSHLQRALPDFMTPKHFSVVTDWPLTLNGKIDQAALFKCSAQSQVREYLEPNTETEKKLVSLVAQVLNLGEQRTSLDASFFELGGNSLLCIRLAAHIEETFGLKLALQIIFDNPTLLLLAGEIDKRVQQRGTQVLQQRKIAKRSERSQAPLSFAQQRLWFIDQLQGSSAEYNIPLAFEVTGAFDTRIAERVLRTLIERHEILRTVYSNEGEQALQYICERCDFALKHLDLTALTPEQQQAQVQQLIDQDTQTAFDLQSDLMIRASYIWLRNIDHEQGAKGVLMFNMHHIASDGWSMEVLLKEFCALYRAFADGLPSPLPELAIQYADYATWQHCGLQDDLLESQLRYWQMQLDQVPPLHALPLDKARPELKKHQGQAVVGVLPAEVSQSLLALAERHKLTPFMLLHGAFALLLARHSNCSDILVGTPVANRLQAELEPLIGFFINTLVLRVDTAYQHLSDYLAHVRQVHIEAQSNQDIPFEYLLEALQVPRTTAHNPLFQIMLTTNTDYGLNSHELAAELAMPGLKFAELDSDSVQAKFDLELDLSISEQGARLNWTYDVSLFEHTRIEQLNDHLCRLLGALAQIEPKRDTPLNHLPMLSDSEIEHLVYERNQTQAQHPKDRCIHTLFEHCAAAHPHRTALLFENTQLTYGQVNEKANQLARYLRSQHGVLPDTLVGLCVERSAEMVIAILAILKAGGAYVPLDPDYPQDRLQYIAKDTGISLLLTQSHLSEPLIQFSGSRVMLDGLAATESTLQVCAEMSPDNIPQAETGVTARHLAYVIYTSDSTDQPKGVMVEHYGVTNLLYAQHKNYGLGQGEVGLLLASFAFDVSVEQMFIMLSKSGALLIPDQDMLLSVEKLGGAIERHGVTHIHSTPSYLLSFAQVLSLPSIRRVVSGGEAMLPGLLDYVHADLFYVYGPSGASVTTSVLKVKSGAGNHIAGPIDNTQFYLLGQAQELLPLGAVGELYIGGDALARGYLNQPQLTAQRFIKNPYFDPTRANSPQRLYRTGDRVRYLAHGQLEFIGRADEQIKMRGFRIEPGEVEAQINRLPAVESALVLTSERAGRNQLLAYVKVQSVSDKAELVQTLKATLAESLPHYMVPAQFVVIDEWPLTPSGKIDRRALPQPDVSLLQAEHIFPETETEKALVAIWSELLNIDKQAISVTADFFDLGGNSLLVIRLKSSIQSQFNVEFQVKDLFSRCNIKTLASLLSAHFLKAELDNASSEELEEVEF